MKKFSRMSRFITLICFVIFYILINSYSQESMVEYEKINWEKVYFLVTNDKLPKLSLEEERKILEETDKILTETKSLHSACNFLLKKVSDGSGEKSYLVIGNEKIKEKLVELFKMRKQCELKDSILTDFRESVMEREDLSEEDKVRVLKWHEMNKQFITNSLKELISKDGDRCLECFINDLELSKLLTPPFGKEREFEPEGVYEDIEAFNTVALSTFLPGMYDYLWLSKYIHGVEPPPFDILSFYITKLYPNEFLNDILKGFIKDRYIYRKQGEFFQLEEVFNIVSMMIKYNPSFVSENKDKIKSTLRGYYGEFEENIGERSKELLEKIQDDCNKESLTRSIESMQYVYIDGLRIREKMLNIYERIGEKEDIEDIKRLGEGIKLDYPIRETNREGDEEMKERYLKRVKDLQERINTLVDKLSQQ